MFYLIVSLTLIYLDNNELVQNFSFSESTADECIKESNANQLSKELNWEKAVLISIDSRMPRVFIKRKDCSMGTIIRILF